MLDRPGNTINQTEKVACNAPRDASPCGSWQLDKQKRAERGTSDKALSNTTLHPAVFKLIFGIFTIMMGAYLIRFSGDGYATFMVAISIFYFLMYFGVPIVMFREHPKEGRCTERFSDFLKEPFETITGTITGLEATIQACLIPTMITICTIVFCVIG